MFNSGLVADVCTKKAWNGAITGCELVNTHELVTPL
jgi:hypothetical protein